METMLKLQTLSAPEFARFGIAKTAYVKPILAAGRTLYAVHAADGTFLSQYCDRETACAALRQHDMMPANVH
jgi:hypothetical protein